MCITIFNIFIISFGHYGQLIPSLSNVNLPLDTIEALAWGSNLDWGFNKHPPIVALQLKFFYQFLVDKIGHIIY